MEFASISTPVLGNVRDLDRIERVRHRSSLAPDLAKWQRPQRGYYRALINLLRSHIPPGKRVLQVGCGMGDLLASVKPAHGVGIDLSPPVVNGAARRYPTLDFRVDDPEAFSLDETFDFVIVGDALAEMPDVQACLERVRSVCMPQTRLITFHHNALWEPLLQALALIGLRRPTDNINWLSTQDMRNMLFLSGFDVISHTGEVLLPVQIPLLSNLCNRFLTRMWPLQHLSLINVIIARPAHVAPVDRTLTCSVVVPTRNECGNIESAVNRIPDMGAHTEIIFVDGNSTDGTADEIERVMSARPDRDIQLLHQGEGRGKGDAVRKGFAAGTGDVLMILDADLTVMPEDLPKFFDCVASGKAEFVNGTRLVYPMERQAMRTLNRIANWLFSVLFSWLLGQKFRDTLCGTKVLRRESYETIARNRSFFGDFDPFGDFDLIFGASKADLRIMEVPVRYRARRYGETNIQRFRHGLLLLRMSLVAMRKLKFR